MSESRPGPLVLHQVSTVPTGYAYVSRCGCGWRGIHAELDAALTSGRYHIETAHATGTGTE